MKKVIKYALIALAVVFAIPLLLLVLLLLSFPIRYKIFAKIDEKKDVRLKISYLFGLLRYVHFYDDEKNEGNLCVLWFRVGGKPKTAKRKKPAVKNFFEMDSLYSFVQKNLQKIVKDATLDSDKEREGLKESLTLQEIKTIIKDSVGTLKKLLLAVRPGYFRLAGEVGLTCPAKTAYLYGAFMAVTHFFGFGKNISLLPVFENESTVWRIDTEARGFINFYRLLVPLALFALRTPVMNMILKGDAK